VWISRKSRIVAFPLGYPYTTEMGLLAARFENLYACTSLLPRFALGYSKKAQEILGEFLAVAGPDKADLGYRLVRFAGRTQGSGRIFEDHSISEETSARLPLSPYNSGNEREVGRSELSQDPENQSPFRPTGSKYQEMISRPLSKIRINKGWS